MKSILVIDTPDGCRDCTLRYDNYGTCDVCILADDIVDHFYETNTKPDWCPLKPMPDVKEVPQYEGNGVYGFKTAEKAHYAMGYNSCVRELMGNVEYFKYIAERRKE